MVSFIRKVNKQQEQAVIVYLEEDQLTQDGMIYTKGAFNIHFHFNNYIYIDYVGEHFDASDITKGKATHESWKIPFEELLFLKVSNINKYKIFTISEEEFQNSFATRKKQMLIEHSNRSDEIVNIETIFRRCPNNVLDLLLDEIVVPIYSQMDYLTKTIGNEFGIQLNINNNSEIEVYEINRPERMKMATIK